MECHAAQRCRTMQMCRTTQMCRAARRTAPGLAFVLLVTLILHSATADEDPPPSPMSSQEKQDLKEEARDMFYHAYRAYMDKAYPADELMPLSCRGRYRGAEPSRGDIDDVLGNFSLTLIDTLDTLAVLGDVAEFEHAVRLVIRDVSFDSDLTVSVFETNIRVLGGLLSGHVLAEYMGQTVGAMQWYRGELLVMAQDLGRRLLPAFNTSTGIPRARINLRRGVLKEGSQETCTACAGTMILEMAALSRLTGDPVFEEKAHGAMSSLWRMRHRGSDLMGTVLNVHSGDWVRRDSGVGAGIDSYYEYCLKAYVLLGDNRYLSRFNKHYSAVMKYVSQGPMLVDVHMHRPHTNSRNFMDALLAFWPALQVLTGDLKPAVETHEMLYQVMQRHNFIPEAFTTDFQVHWGQYPLRPEFLESTYFLYRATGDPYYLSVGKKVLKALQRYARVPCGYAAVGDVRTGHHDDRMDSFVLAETLKYLFLLFAESSDLLVDLDRFVFTTEAHLLPLTLANKPSNSSFLGEEDGGGSAVEDAPQCPSTLRLFPHAVRKPLKNLVHQTCPRSHHRRLTANNFQSGNPEHKRLIRDMGITIAQLDDGRIQLLHTVSKARSLVEAEEGLLFMQEMMELAKAQAPGDTAPAPPHSVSFLSDRGPSVLTAGPAHFGKQLTPADKVVGRVGVADPVRACGPITNGESLRGRIAVVQRGDCMFIDKARRVSAAGAIAGLVVDNQVTEGGAGGPHLFAMSGDGRDDVDIPFLFLFSTEAYLLLHTLLHSPATVVTLSQRGGDGEASPAEESQPMTSLDRFKHSLNHFLFNQQPQEGKAKEEWGELDAEKIEEVLELARKEAATRSDGATVVSPQRLQQLLQVVTQTTGEPLDLRHRPPRDEL